MVMFHRPFPMTQPVVELRGFKKGLDNAGLLAIAEAVAKSKDRVKKMTCMTLNKPVNYAQDDCKERTKSWALNSINKTSQWRREVETIPIEDAILLRDGIFILHNDIFELNGRS
jgi:hypothetical protein